jgi:hypothetical protein
VSAWPHQELENLLEAADTRLPARAPA